jgi:hypothetical protein
MIIARYCANRKLLSPRLLALSVGVISALFLAVLAAKAPLHASELPGINGSPDPYELYGRCTDAAVFRGKQEHVYAANRNTSMRSKGISMECSP